MAQHSVSAGWDRQERRHKYRPNASDLSLNQSGNPRKAYEGYRRDEEPLRRKGPIEARHSEPQQQSMDNVYEEDVNGGHHARPRKRPSTTGRATDGLDIDAGGFHSQETRHPRSSGNKMRAQSPVDVGPVTSAPAAHNLHSKVSPVRSPRLPTAAGPQQRLPGPPSPPTGRRRSSNKQYSSHGRHQESESQSSLKRPRLPTKRSPPPVVDERRQIRRSPSKSPQLIPTGPARHTSPPSLHSIKRRPSHNEQHSPVSRRQRSESPRSSKREPLLDRQVSPPVTEVVHKPDRSLSRSPPTGITRTQKRAASPLPPPPSRVRSSHRNQYSPVSRTRRSELSPPPKQDHVHGRQKSSIIEEGARNQRRSLSKSPSANVPSERRLSSPVSPRPSRGRTDFTRQLSPVSGTLQSLSPSPPSRGRTPTPKLRPSLERRELQRQRPRGHSPLTQWELPEEPAGGRRSSYEPPEARTRSLTPLRRGSPSPKQASERLSSSPNRRNRHSLTPLRRHVPPVEVGAQPNRASSPLGGNIKPRSITPRIRGQSPRSGRKRSPLYSGEKRRRPSVEDALRRRDRSRTPIGYRERSRSRTPPRRKSPSPVPQSRRSRSPDSKRRSSRRSPQREQSPRRVSPRRRSSPGRYRSSRRDRRASPGSRRAWSPVQNRRNGIGKPGNNLFIAGFNFITTERDLERKFSRYGRVMDVRIVRDKRSGESRGFGFLTLERDEDADAAIKSLDQTEWNGRIVLVEKAKTPTRF